MKRIKFILFLLVFTQFAYAQQDRKKNDAWFPFLSDVKVRYIFSVKYQAMIPKPKFGEELQAMEGKTITIRGFFLPVDMTGNVYVISFNPSNMCFFCSGAGIESIIELNPTDDDKGIFKRLDTDDYFEVKGKLKLNVDDYDHLIYILDDVVFMRIIKY